MLGLSCMKQKSKQKRGHDVKSCVVWLFNEKNHCLKYNYSSEPWVWSHKVWYINLGMNKKSAKGHKQNQHSQWRLKRDIVNRRMGASLVELGLSHNQWEPYYSTHKRKVRQGHQQVTLLSDLTTTCHVLTIVY